MAKQKYYVVWSGRKTGIFTSWDECKQQVHGYQGASYKSYTSKEEAEEAFRGGIKSGVNQNENKKQTSTDYIANSISVDAACSGNPGDMEYQGVYTENGKVIFHFGPVPNGTNNIGEFLAIVHALALLKQQNSSLPVYSDSQIALGWVRKKQANTSIPRNASTEQLWNLIERAEQWLKSNTYSNQLLKWETKQWGESKADFGRK
ncbi:MAG TPA: ribonuclease H family protein [Candidatus Dormibacteraeota bacterium]|nr:ribonuclease H family protein [Candidatus Dormibacteraeota bacterium]